MNRLAKEGAPSLYAELEKVDPDYAQQTEQQNSQRIVRALEIYHSSGKKYSELRTGMNSIRDFDLLFLGLERDRDELYQRINLRMEQMINDGLFDEASSLIAFKEKNALQTVGYNEVFLYLDGQIDKKEAVRILKRNSRRYAKRQMTWFKRNPDTVWFHPDQIDQMEALIREKLHT
jgi:tRNA dimethylallyltransferase